MRKLFIILALCTAVTDAATAQQPVVNVHLMNGATEPYPLSLIDSMVFSTFLQPSQDIYLSTGAVISSPITAIDSGTFAIDANVASCGAPVVHSPAQNYGTMTDQQGNVYRTIVIGTQEWMAENLKTGIYRNGEAIGEVTDNGQWQALASGAWSYYNNDPQRECPYGRLYNWFAVADPRNLCPSGWHLPSDAEWSALIGHLDPANDPIAVGTQSTTAGGSLKSAGQLYWQSPNTDATNTSGFSALPGGFRNVNGPFLAISGSGWWWSATALDADNAFARQLVASGGNVNRITTDMNRGIAIRCVKDPAGLGSISTLDCGNATNVGTLTAGTVANGVSSTLAYTGGNGGTHSGQTVNATGVTGLTATLAAGSVANGSGTLTWTITGTPNAAGTASFALNIAGQGCTLNLVVGSSSLNPNLTYGSVADQQGNTYATIVIGTQEWMAENLRTTQYSDGTPITLVTDPNQWAANNTTIPMMCWYDNDQATYTANRFGALYNWYALSSTTNGNRNVCPTGWHVPTDAEWSTLINYLDPNADGGNNINTAGGKMKSTGTQYWQSPNTGATNESGFSGLPGGYRTDGGQFGSGFGYWWSYTESSTVAAWNRILPYSNGSVGRANLDKAHGFSVRCLRD